MITTAPPSSPLLKANASLHLVSLKADTAARIKRARVKSVKLLARICAAHQAGEKRKADYLTAEYLRSDEAKLMAVDEASRHLPPHKRPPLATLPKIARTLSPWRGTQEEVRALLIPKHWGTCDTRTILDFGIENRALQYQVRELLLARTDFLPNQYASAGGTHAAVRQARKMILAGYRWVTEVDIANFYPSINLDKHPLLTLPKEVQLHTLANAHLNMKWQIHSFLKKLETYPQVVTSSSLDTHQPHSAAGTVETVLAEENFSSLFAGEFQAARRGIAQGSAASPVIAEIVLAQVLAALPLGSVVLNYADNFLLLSETEEEAVSMLEILCCALKAHPAGPLMPKPRRYKPGDVVEFLGFALTADPTCWIEPSPENLCKFKKDFAEQLKWAAKAPPSDKSQRFALVRQKVKGWCASFSPWYAVKQHQAHYLALLKNAAKN